jgi:hypothetical protein
MSECKLRVVKLNYFQGPQGIFIMGGENVGVADGIGMTLYKVKILLWRWWEKGKAVTEEKGDLPLVLAGHQTMRCEWGYRKFKSESAAKVQVMFDGELSSVVGEELGHVYGSWISWWIRLFWCQRTKILMDLLWVLLSKNTSFCQIDLVYHQSG